MGDDEEKAGKVKITIVLPQSLMDRIQEARKVSKRNLSAEIEYGMERHVEDVEREQRKRSRSS